MNNKLSQCFLQVIKMTVFLVPFLIGIYHEFLSAVVAVFLMIFLLCIIIKEKKLNIEISLPFIFVSVFLLLYLIAEFWAVDKGMNIFGFVKFFPLLPFSVILMQTDDAQKNEIKNVIPYSAAVMTVTSFAMSFIPAIGNYFTVSDRLGGFFQYPNTFALFALIGLEILATKAVVKWQDAVLAVVLLFGILASGSRTVFVLTVCALILLTVFANNRKTRISLVLMMLVGAVGVSIYIFKTGNMENIGRFLTTSLTESTFMGRLLYYKDAFFEIITHPFGLGYMGYYYTQSSFQTGVYSVMFVHNDLLQIMLDVGWIPAILFVCTLAKAFLRKGPSICTRMVIFTVFAHIMLDFDLQFVSIFMILLLFSDSKPLATYEIKSFSEIITAVVLIIPVCLYFGIASFAYFVKDYNTAVSIYPAYTSAHLKLLTQEETADLVEERADKILSLNKEVSLAYSAKALCAFSQGDIQSMIEYKRIALEKAPYQIDEYEDYAKMLIIGYDLYIKNSDSASANYCKMELLNIQDLLNEVKAGTDPLAWKIDDKPQLELSDEIKSEISSLE